MCLVEGGCLDTGFVTNLCAAEDDLGGGMVGHGWRTTIGAGLNGGFVWK